MGFLTLIVAGAVGYGSVLLLVPPQWFPWLLFEWRTHLCHLKGVLTAPTRVHCAPVQPRAPGRRKREEKRKKVSKVKYINTIF
jgi:hypothetical protein